MFSVVTRDRLVCLVATVLLLAQLLAFGAMSNLLAAIFAYLEVVTCLLVILALFRDRTDRLWASAAGAIALFLAAICWAAAPLLPGALHPPGPAPLAPDTVGLELLKLAGVGAVCLIGAQIGLTRRRMRQFILYLVVAGLALGALSLWMWQTSPETVWGRPKLFHTLRFSGVLLNANAAGCVFAMFSLVSLGLLQSLLRRIDWRNSTFRDYLPFSAAAAATFLSFGACVLTQSRAAIVLSLALGLGMMAIDARRRRRSGRAVLVLSAIILLAAIVVGIGQFESRWGQLPIDAQVRAQADAGYLRALAGSPWFGYGLGGFRSLHELIMKPDLAPAIWAFGAAHLAILQAALEGGAPFAALLLAAGGLIVAKIARANMAGARMGAITTGAAAAALLAFAFSFVDIALNVPAIAAFSAALLGVAWGSAIAATASRQPFAEAR
jgi:O-antigen ligase